MENNNDIKEFEKQIKNLRREYSDVGDARARHAIHPHLRHSLFGAMK